jgi:hypothetical protein
MVAKRVVQGKAVAWIAALTGLAAVVVTGVGLTWTPCRHIASPVYASESASSVTPLWLQSSGEDDPASVENDTPFPDSKVVVNAQWTTPRYFPNPKIQAADIIPVTWASDGDSYVSGDDGSVHGVKGTTVISRILGTPPTDNSVPNMDFKLLAQDAFLYGCPKSVTADSCYSVGLTNVNGVFYAPTFDKGYPIVGDHPPGHARMDYSTACDPRSNDVRTYPVAQLPIPVLNSFLWNQPLETPSPSASPSSNFRSRSSFPQTRLGVVLVLDELSKEIARNRACNVLGVYLDVCRGGRVRSGV